MPLQWQSRSCYFSFCPFGHIPFKSSRLVMRDNLLYATANLETTGLKLFFLDAQTSFDQQFMSRHQTCEIIIIAKNQALRACYFAQVSVPQNLSSKTHLCSRNRWSRRRHWKLGFQSFTRPARTSAGEHPARRFSRPPCRSYHSAHPSRWVYLLLLLDIFHPRADRSDSISQKNSRA